MALYAALTFWLLVIMFAAWGVHHMWSTLLKPRAVNAALLPGTLIAQLGHVLGLLLAGSSVGHLTLMSDDDRGEPEADHPAAPRLPIIGPILIGLLPLVACGASLYLVAQWWGRSMLADGLGVGVQAPQALPTTLGGFWELLRTCVDLAEAMVAAVLRSDLPNWQTVLFLYLAVCLTVRMAPFEGHRRGAIGAVVLAAVVIAVLASLVPQSRAFIEQSSWPVLSFAVALLLCLLLITLAVRGVVGLFVVLGGKRGRS